MNDQPQPDAEQGKAPEKPVLTMTEPEPESPLAETVDGRQVIDFSAMDSDVWPDVIGALARDFGALRFREGHAAGFAEGLRQGLADGRAEGQAKLDAVRRALDGDG